MKKLSPTVLSVLAVAGVIGTAVTAARATPKAIMLIEEAEEERHLMNLGKEDPDPFTTLDKIKASWTCYIPSVAIGAATILCIFGANGLNKRQQASLVSAYALLDQTYKDFKSKTDEMYGENSSKVVQTEVIKDLYDEEDLHYDEETIIFYEEHYGEFFERSKAQVREAEYLLNRKYAYNGEACLNDFYRFLGLKEKEIGDILGWSNESSDNFFSYHWIEFEHNLIKMDDGMECYSIDMPFAPAPGWILPF